MLWVRIPPGPMKLPSWSSQECSPLCQGGGRGFKSRWGGCDGTVRKPAKRPSSNLGERLWVRFPPVLSYDQSLRSGLESGSQHGLISRPTPVQIRPPQFRDQGAGDRETRRQGHLVTLNFLVHM